MQALLADVLTFMRLIAAAALAWLGAAYSPAALPLAVAIMALGWTTDQLDGWAARRSATPTRFGPHEFAVDVIFYAGILAYLTLAGFVSWAPALAFSLVSVLAALITRRKAVIILSLRVVDVACAITVVRYLPIAAVLALAWLGLLAVLYRKRLRERVPRWIDELADVFGVRKRPFRSG